MALTDLTGTTWTFNDVLNYEENSITYSLNFQSNNEDFTQLLLNYTQSQQMTRMRYRIASTTSNKYVYENGWVLPIYKTITVTGGTDATNSTLISWLKANATWTNQPEGVFISYSGSEITSMEESGTRTLLTSGKYCESDIVVEYTKPTPKLQEKTVTPTTEQQIVTADSTTVIANTGDFSQSGTPTYNNPSTTGYYSFPMDLSAIETGKTYHVTGSGQYMAHNGQAITNYTIDDDWVAGNDDIPLSINTLSVHLTWTSSGLKFTMPTAYAQGDRNIQFSGNISFAVSSDYDGLSKVTVNGIPSANGVSF